MQSPWCLPQHVPLSASASTSFRHLVSHSNCSGGLPSRGFLLSCERKYPSSMINIQTTKHYLKDCTARSLGETSCGLAVCSPALISITLLVALASFLHIFVWLLGQVCTAWAVLPASPHLTFLVHRSQFTPVWPSEHLYHLVLRKSTGVGPGIWGRDWLNRQCHQEEMYLETTASTAAKTKLRACFPVLPIEAELQVYTA